MRWHVEQAGPHGVRGRGCPGGKVELAQDVRDVPVHRMLAHHEPFGDLRGS